MNALSWSIPFLCEKVAEIMIYLMNVKAKKEVMPQLPAEEEVLKIKIGFLSKLFLMYKTLREENELILKLKSLVNSSKLPRGMLL